MSQINIKRTKLWSFSYLIVLLIMAALVLTSCSTANGQDMAERSAAFDAARTYGFDFDDTLISTAYGASSSEIIITGPIVRRTEDSSGYIVKSMYTEVILENADGEWKLLSAIND